MKRWLQLTALLLVLAVLSGCGFSSLFMPQPGGTELTYTRPDMDEHERVLEEACQAARTETDLDKVLDQIYTYYDVYDRFYAANNLSYIHYCSDVTDIYWEQEYDFCAQNLATVDAGLESLYYALADSPIREQLEAEEHFGAGFFDSYQGENQWDDPELIALFEEETALINEYYALSEAFDAADYYSDSWFDENEPKMGQLLVDLIRVRQQQAAYFGYDSYQEFSYDFYHYRDYTPQQAIPYLEEVAAHLVDIYKEANLSDVWELGWEESTDRENFAYVKGAAQAMRGDIAEAFRFLEENKLYDIAWGENKYPISFETFIPHFYVPFVFMAPDGTVYDRLTFAHEFGHFVNDYVCDGSSAGTDVAEIHSQTMEYLSLFYGENTEDLTRLKLADSLCVYVEQAAYALFEHKAYDLQGEALTVENVRALYGEVGTAFGFDSWDWDSRDYVTMSHFYDHPMYVISYVVSNDLAMQIYQLEAEESGAGLEIYEECIQSGDSFVMAFAQEYGLESPFAPGRLEAVRKTFETALD